MKIESAEISSADAAIMMRIRAAESATNPRACVPAAHTSALLDCIILGHRIFYKMYASLLIL